MIETIGNWFTALMEWASAMPPQGWAVLLGILLGGAVTQWVKRTFPLSVMFPGLAKQWQVSIIRILAFCSGFIATYILWPDDEYELWASLIVGFATPTVYRVLSYFIFKKWPGMEDRWSGTK